MSFLFFTLAQFFANGKWLLPLASWLAPIFLVYSIRGKKGGISLILGFLVYLASYLICWRGMIPGAPWLYFLILFGVSLVFYLPFCIDFFLSRKIQGFPSTFILPLSGVVIEFAYSVLSPFGVWGIMAKTQPSHGSFIQILSLVGPGGVVFLVYWCASMVNWIFREKLHWARVRRGILTFLLIVMAVLIYGNIKERFLETEETVAVAAIAPDWEHKYTNPQRNHILEKFYSGQPVSWEEQVLLSEINHPDTEQLQQYTLSQARRGAKIIVWAEGACEILDWEEDRLRSWGRAIAREYQIYLIMGIQMFSPGQDPAETQKLLIFLPNGGVEEHLKSVLLPGDSHQVGQGVLPILDTPYGRVALSLCFESDFPEFPRQARDADIYIVPSKDWEEVNRTHDQMTRQLAVKYGFSLIRVTTRGTSSAVNPHGESLGSMDYFTTSLPVMTFHVPTRGIRTVYSGIGIAFEWLNLVFLAYLIGVFIKKSLAEKEVSKNE